MEDFVGSPEFVEYFRAVWSPRIGYFPILSLFCSVYALPAWLSMSQDSWNLSIKYLHVIGFPTFVLCYFHLKLFLRMFDTSPLENNFFPPIVNRGLDKCVTIPSLGKPRDLCSDGALPLSAEVQALE